jgi:hypothetical protein
MCKVRAEIHSRPYLKYNTHWVVFHQTHLCSETICNMKIRHTVSSLMLWHNGWAWSTHTAFLSLHIPRPTTILCNNFNPLRQAVINKPWKVSVIKTATQTLKFWNQNTCLSLRTITYVIPSADRILTNDVRFTVFFQTKKCKCTNRTLLRTLHAQYCNSFILVALFHLHVTILRQDVNTTSPHFHHLHNMYTYDLWQYMT